MKKIYEWKNIEKKFHNAYDQYYVVMFFREFEFQKQINKNDDFNDVLNVNFDKLVIETNEVNRYHEQNEKNWSTTVASIDNCQTYSISTKKNVLMTWKHLKNEYFRLNKMTKNIIIVFVAKINCEKMFNIVDNFYNCRNLYNSKTFLILMMMHCYDKNQNKKLKFHVDLNENNDGIFSKKIIKIENENSFEQFKNFAFCEIY